MAVTTVNYRQQLIDAYNAGAYAATLYAVQFAPKPDAKEWLARQNATHKPIARG
jgi:hypothetical protein